MHHSSKDDPVISKAMMEALTERQEQVGKILLSRKEAEQALGATGEFPEGKLTPADEGEIQFGVAAHEGKVIIEFGKPVHWLGMSPGQAQDLAQSLWGHAYEILNEKKR